MSVEIDQLTNLLFSIAGLSGVGGLFWGIYQYKQSGIEKRKNILFELVKEFDKSTKMGHAKRILDDFNLKPQKEWTKEYGYYHKRNLSDLLKSHYLEGVDDKGKSDIRDSFDALFDFFDRLGYLYKVGLVKEDELSHFEYFLKRARENEAVLNYVKVYGSKWLKQLPKNIKD